MANSAHERSLCKGECTTNVTTRFVKVNQNVVEFELHTLKEDRVKHNLEEWPATCHVQEILGILRPILEMRVQKASRKRGCKEAEDCSTKPKMITYDYSGFSFFREKVVVYACPKRKLQQTPSKTRISATTSSYFPETSETLNQNFKPKLPRLLSRKRVRQKVELPELSHNDIEKTAGLEDDYVIPVDEFMDNSIDLPSASFITKNSPVRVTREERECTFSQVLASLPSSPVFKPSSSSMVGGPRLDDSGAGSSISTSSVSGGSGNGGKCLATKGRGRWKKLLQLVDELEEEGDLNLPVETSFTSEQPDQSAGCCETDVSVDCAETNIGQGQPSAGSEGPKSNSLQPKLDTSCDQDDNQSLRLKRNKLKKRRLTEQLILKGEQLQKLSKSGEFSQVSKVDMSQVMDNRESAPNTMEDDLRAIRNVADLTVPQLTYLVTKHEKDLLQIFQGKKFSRRHQDYKTGGKQRNNLKFDIPMGGFTDEQHDTIIELLLAIFCRKHNKVPFLPQQETLTHSHKVHRIKRISGRSRRFITQCQSYGFKRKHIYRFHVYHRHWKCLKWEIAAPAFHLLFVISLIKSKFYVGYLLCDIMYFAEQKYARDFVFRYIPNTQISGVIHAFPTHCILRKSMRYARKFVTLPMCYMISNSKRLLEYFKFEDTQPARNSSSPEPQETSHCTCGSLYQTFINHSLFVQTEKDGKSDIMDDTNNGVKTLLYLLQQRLHTQGESLQGIVQRLVEEGSLLDEDDDGVSVGVSLLHSVTAKGHVEDVELLLAGGEPGLVNCSSHRGGALLHVAANRGHIAVVNTLLRRGADINSQRPHDKYTPLHVAALAGRTATVRCLLAAGADPTIANLYGNRPLHLAAGSGHIDLLKELLAAGAPTDDENSIGNTPLATAARNDHEAIVEHLLKLGANPNVLYSKRLPLLQVLLNERLPYVALQLLRYGAAPPAYPVIKSWLQSRNPKLLEREMLVFLALLLSGNDPDVVKDILRDAQSKAIRYPQPIRVWLNKNANGPCQLKMICRQRVRHMVLSKNGQAFAEHLRSLPLPAPLTDFLFLDDLMFDKIPLRIVYRTPQAAANTTNTTPWTSSSSESNLTLELDT